MKQARTQSIMEESLRVTDISYECQALNPNESQRVHKKGHETRGRFHNFFWLYSLQRGRESFFPTAVPDTGSCTHFVYDTVVMHRHVWRGLPGLGGNTLRSDFFPRQYCPAGWGRDLTNWPRPVAQRAFTLVRRTPLPLGLSRR